MVGHAVIVRGRYCTLIKRRKHYERLDIPFANIRGGLPGDDTGKGCEILSGQSAK